MSNLQLQVGKRYLRRDGEIVLISATGGVGGHKFPYTADKLTYESDGAWLSGHESDFDIVAEAEDSTPEPGPPNTSELSRSQFGEEEPTRVMDMKTRVSIRISSRLTDLLRPYTGDLLGQELFDKFAEFLDGEDEEFLIRMLDALPSPAREV